MDIIKKNNYYGVVITIDGDKLFVMTPRFKKVFKRAGENAAAYERYLELKAQYIKDAVDSKVSKENPLTKYEMDAFFSNKKKIESLISNKTKAKKLTKNLKVTAKQIAKMAEKVNALIQGLDTQATFMNAKAVEDISVKLDDVIKAFNSNEILNTIYTLSTSLVSEENDDFNVEEFLEI